MKKKEGLYLCKALKSRGRKLNFLFEEEGGITALSVCVCACVCVRERADQQSRGSTLLTCNKERLPGLHNQRKTDLPGCLQRKSLKITLDPLISITLVIYCTIVCNVVQFYLHTWFVDENKCFHAHKAPSNLNFVEEQKEKDSNHLQTKIKNSGFRNISSSQREKRGRTR